MSISDAAPLAPGATWQGIARPVRVTAAGSTGVASGTFNMNTEDAITLLVEWENFEDKSK